MVGALLSALALTGTIALHAQNPVDAVRPEDPELRELIARGIERSPTFQDLVTRLNASDVVVYVRFSRCTGPVPTCLLWAERGQGVRRLVIRVNRFGLSKNELMALLGHELQHACEVASEPDVKDATSFRAAFQRRGWKTGDGFETREAQAVGHQVRKEISTYRVDRE